MNYKEINRKQALLVLIGLLFFSAALYIVCMMRASSVQREGKLSVDSLSSREGDDYYSSVGDLYSGINNQRFRHRDAISFILKDSLVASGFSKGNYLVFEKGEDGYDRPIRFARIPSWIHPSFCIDENPNQCTNINSIFHFYYNKYEEDFYFKNLILNQASHRGDVISLSVPSINMDTYHYKHHHEDSFRVLVNGIDMSLLIKEMMQTPEEVVDSIFTDALGDLTHYGQYQRCHTSDNYAEILSSVFRTNNLNDALVMLLKDSVAALPTQQRCEVLLEKNKERIKTLISDISELQNALQQLIDGYHWITPDNYQTLSSLREKESFFTLSTGNDREREIIELLCDMIGYTGDRENTKTLRYTLDFWEDRWEEGSAEWCYRMFQRMLK